MKMNTTEYFFSPYWHVNLSETIDWMEADLNESLQFIVRKGRVKKSEWLEKICIHHHHKIELWYFN